MATMELPPRRGRIFSEATIQRNRSSLDVLVQMGFPKHRAEKALAATGDKGVQLASDWLLSHVNDPTIDEVIPREYILYLCPVGQLQQQLLEFWQKSYAHCGWNRAHNFFPHITLCSFFKAEDSQVPKLAHALKTVADQQKDKLQDLNLEYFSSTNFIGIFVAEACAPYLKQVTQDFAEEVKKTASVTVEPHKKQLHISMAYQFPTEHKEKLEVLAKCINLEAPVRWDIRLYSRDPRVNSLQVRKVLYPHNPRMGDELEMIVEDFVYLDESELQASPDGWYKGTSWLTGCCGMFPGNYTERTAESETWTMHRSIPIIGTEDMGAFGGIMMRADGGTAANAAANVMDSIYENIQTLGHSQSFQPSNTFNPQRTSSLHRAVNGPMTAENQLYTQVHNNCSGSGFFGPSSSGTFILQNAVGSFAQPLSSGAFPSTSSGGGSFPSSSSMPGSGGGNFQASSSSSGAFTTSSPGSGAFASPGSGSGVFPTSNSGGPFSATSHSNQRNDQQRKLILPKTRNKGPAPAPPAPSSPKPSRHRQAESPKMSRRSMVITSNEANTPRPVRPSEQSVTLPVTGRSPATMNDTSAAASRPSRSSDPTPRTSLMENSHPIRSAIRPVGGPRQLYVVRHGERVDFTFGKDWIQMSFDQAGNYIRHDLNMPRSLPKRKGGPQDFSKDSPLTVQGHFQAEIIGEALREKDVPISHVYASPSLRCVETAASILAGMGLEREIYLEPGLFEWLGWYQSGLPKFMTAAEYRESGFPVGQSHQPIWPITKYNVHETTEQYYERCFHVTKEILKKHEHDGGNVMIVAHAASLDVCTRQLVSLPPRSHTGFHDVLHKIPYLAVSVCQEDCLVRNKWNLIEPPILAFAHTNNPKYNWSVLNVPSLI